MEGGSGDPSWLKLTLDSEGDKRVGEGGTWMSASGGRTWCLFKLALGWTDRTWFVRPDSLRNVFGHPANGQRKTWKALRREPRGITRRKYKSLRTEVTSQTTWLTTFLSTKKIQPCRTALFVDPFKFSFFPNFQVHSIVTTWIACLKHNQMKN